MGAAITAVSVALVSEQSILKGKLSVFLTLSRFPNAVFSLTHVMNTKVLIRNSTIFMGSLMKENTLSGQTDLTLNLYSSAGCVILGKFLVLSESQLH